jgi:hypothetical protein
MCPLPRRARSQQSRQQNKTVITVVFNADVGFTGICVLFVRLCLGAFRYFVGFAASLRQKCFPPAVINSATLRYSKG